MSSALAPPNVCIAHKDCPQAQGLIRKGLLDEIPHRRVIRDVVIVRTEDARRVVRLLEEIGAEVHMRRVELTKEDRAQLTV